MIKMHTGSLKCDKVAQITWLDCAGIDFAISMCGDSAYDKKY